MSEKSYEAQVGLDYVNTDGKTVRVEPGETADKLPLDSWVIEAGLVKAKPVKRTPSPSKVTSTEGTA